MRCVPAAEADDRFRLEADMLAPLAVQSDQLLPDAVVFFEVACTAGVPDLVLLDIDADAVASRVDTTTLAEPIDVRVILAVQRSQLQPMTIADLSKVTRVSTAHLRRTVLPRLADGGHIASAGDGWRSLYRWQSLARRVVTIEAKLRDWRRGLAQATRHTAVADEAWLVLDSKAARSALSHASWFATYGVGLAALSVHGELTTLLRPGVNRSRAPDRELLVERAIDLRRNGSTSGPVPRVFGTWQVATRGADPRLPNGAVH